MVLSHLMKDFAFIIVINSVAVTALVELLVTILTINSTKLPPWYDFYTNSANNINVRCWFLSLTQT